MNPVPAFSVWGAGTGFPVMESVYPAVGKSVGEPCQGGQPFRKSCQLLG